MIPLHFLESVMCLRDVLATLRTEGLSITEPQIRWAITSGKINRPLLDGSLRFVFDDQHLEQLRQLFATKSTEEVEKC